jgi:hypothetical protein
MKTSRYLFFMFFLFLFEISVAQPGLIAYYPLNSNPNDTTGNLGPVTLTNIPYADGGVYSDGDYFNTLLQTPALPTSIFQAFSVSVKFKVTDFPTGKDRPVLVGGGNYRWIGIYLMRDSTVALLYNNSHYEHSTVRYTTGNWYVAVVNYDSTLGLANLSIDGAPVCTVHFTLEHDASSYDRIFISINPSNSGTFKGYLRDLMLYSTYEIPTSVASRNSQIPDNILLLQNYPNPFNPATTIPFRLNRSSFVSLDIYNVLGEKVASLVSEELAAGEHEVLWSAEEFASGVYFCRMHAGNTIQIRKLLLNK